MNDGDSDQTRSLNAPEPGKEAPEVVLRVSARSDRGLVRTNNEDSYCVSNLSLPPQGDEEATEDVGRVGPKGILLAVSDGMGGQEAGEVASKIAVDTLRGILRTEWGARVERDAIAELRNDIRTAVGRANRAVLDHVAANPERKGMGATLTAAVVLGDRVVVAQVGDSRAYLLRNGFLKALTADQSLAEELVRRGIVKRGTPAYDARKSVLTRAVGQAGELDPDWEIVDLARGDRLLVCSDGLYGPVPDDGLRAILADSPDPEEAVESLVKAAKDGGAPDNVTCIVAYLTGPGLPDAKKLDAGGGTISIRMDSRLAALANEDTLSISSPDKDTTGEFAVAEVHEDDTLSGTLVAQAVAAATAPPAPVDPSSKTTEIAIAPAAAPAGKSPATVPIAPGAAPTAAPPVPGLEVPRNPATVPIQPAKPAAPAPATVPIQPAKPAAEAPKPAAAAAPKPASPAPATVPIGSVKPAPAAASPKPASPAVPATPPAAKAPPAPKPAAVAPAPKPAAIAPAPKPTPPPAPGAAPKAAPPVPGLGAPPARLEVPRNPSRRALVLVAAVVLVGVIALIALLAS